MGLVDVLPSLHALIPPASNRDDMATARMVFRRLVDWWCDITPMFLFSYFQVVAFHNTYGFKVSQVDWCAFASNPPLTGGGTNSGA